MSPNSELGRRLRTGAIESNVCGLGTARPRQPPVLLIYGCCPGLRAWPNWRLAMPVIAKDRRVIAPDLVGFGNTDRLAGITYSMNIWVQQPLDVMDATGVEKADVVGNNSAASSRSRWRSAR